MTGKPNCLGGKLALGLAIVVIGIASMAFMIVFPMFAGQNSLNVHPENDEIEAGEMLRWTEELRLQTPLDSSKQLHFYNYSVESTKVGIFVDGRLAVFDEPMIGQGTSLRIPWTLLRGRQLKQGSLLMDEAGLYEIKVQIANDSFDVIVEDTFIATILPQK